MGWKATGTPVVRRQRDRWVVRVDGIDTETGKHRPRQLGTYPSKRGAEAAARTAVLEGRTGPERGTVGWLVRSWVASRTDISQKGREQYEWVCSCGSSAREVVCRKVAIVNPCASGCSRRP